MSAANFIQDLLSESFSYLDESEDILNAGKACKNWLSALDSYITWSNCYLLNEEVLYSKYINFLRTIEISRDNCRAVFDFIKPLDLNYNKLLEEIYVDFPFFYKKTDFVKLHFPNYSKLRKLRIQYPDEKKCHLKLDLSKNLELTSLDLMFHFESYTYSQENIDLTNNTKLSELSLHYYKHPVNLLNNTNLTDLDLHYYNQPLDLSRNKKLEKLTLHNYRRHLDLSNILQLKILKFTSHF